jgi:hypothetical protein
MADSAEELEGAVGPDRRTFVKRLVLGTVFAAPIVSSFTMSGVEAAFGSEPRSTALASNANQTPQYPKTVQCFIVNANQPFDVTFQDLVPPVPNPPVTLRLQVPFAVFPQHVLPNNTTICVYRGDLNALQSVVGPGQTPVSAYSVKWDTPTQGNPPPFNNTNPHQNASGLITMTVTTADVNAGDPIYTVDSGLPVSAGPPAAAGSWAVSFVTDPNFVVTRVALAPPTTTPAAAEPVTVTPRFTG